MAARGVELGHKIVRFRVPFIYNIKLFIKDYLFT